MCVCVCVCVCVCLSVWGWEGGGKGERREREREREWVKWVYHTHKHTQTRIHTRTGLTEQERIAIFEALGESPGSPATYSSLVENQNAVQDLLDLSLHLAKCSLRLVDQGALDVSASFDQVTLLLHTTVFRCLLRCCCPRACVMVCKRTPAYTWCRDPTGRMR